MSAAQWRFARPFSPVAIALCAALAAAACDRVGGALVNHERPLPSQLGPVPCNPPPPCDRPVDPPPEVTAEPIARVDVEAVCALELSVDCTEAVLDGNDAGLDRAASGCRHRIGPVELASFDASEVSCSSFTVHADELAPDSLRLRGLAWSHVNFSIEVTHPFVLEIEDAELHDVYVRLEGPVTLRIARTSLADVRVTSAEGAAAPSRVELAQVADGDFRLGGTRAFPGSVSIVRGSFRDAQIVAHDLYLESVSLQGGLVDANRLAATDSQFDHVVLSVENAVLSACLLEDMQLRECGSLTMIASDIERSSLNPCRDQPLRVYSSLVIRSLVDGPIESDTTRWEGVRFGRRAPTDLQLWDTRIMSSTFCESADSLRLGAGSTVRCSMCEQGLPSGEAVCSETGLDHTLDAELCPAFEAVAACAEPHVRERPVEDDL